MGRITKATTTAKKKDIESEYMEYTGDRNKEAGGNSRTKEDEN